MSELVSLSIAVSIVGNLRPPVRVRDYIIGCPFLAFPELLPFTDGLNLGGSEASVGSRCMLG